MAGPADEKEKKQILDMQKIITEQHAEIRELLKDAAAVTAIRSENEFLRSLVRELVIDDRPSEPDCE